MDYSLLGSSALRVSRIGYGCMSLGTEERKAIALLHRAADAGINYFDTADIYDDGVNESLVGTAFKGMRDKVIIATKVGNVRRADGKGLDWNPSRQHILESVEQSLRRLQTSYIDLYQLHGGTIGDPLDETIAAFEQLQQEGKIRYYGISSIRPNVIREYASRSKIASVMMQYSLLDRRPEEECLGLLEARNIGVVVRGSVAQGLLAGKSARPYLEHTAQQVAGAAEAVQEISGEKRKPAQSALQYVLQHPAIDAAVVGIRTNEQLQDALDAIAAPPLTAAETSFLNQHAPAHTYKDHR